MPETPSPASPSDPPLDVDGRLARMEDRLARIEDLLTKQQTLTQSLPGHAAALADSFDGAVDGLAQRGVDVDARLRHLIELAEKLTHPEVLQTLERAIETAQSVPPALGTAADTIDGLVARLAEGGVDIDARMQATLQVAERLTAPETLQVVGDLLTQVDAIRELLDSGLLSPGAVHVAGLATRALSQMDLNSVRPVGAFGAYRALGKPDAQRALGVLVTLGRSFGKACREQPNAPQPNGKES